MQSCATQKFSIQFVWHEFPPEEGTPILPLFSSISILVYKERTNHRICPYFIRTYIRVKHNPAVSSASACVTLALAAFISHIAKLTMTLLSATPIHPSVKRNQAAST